MTTIPLCIDSLISHSLVENIKIILRPYQELKNLVMSILRNFIPGGEEGEGGAEEVDV